VFNFNSGNSVNVKSNDTDNKSNTSSISSTTNEHTDIEIKSTTYLNENSTLTISPPPINLYYSFSFWLYLNGSNNNEELSVFSFAKDYPLITYKNDNLNNIYIYPLGRTNNTLIKLFLPLQKWNLINIQYTIRTTDIYINSILYSSVVLDNVLPDFSKNSAIVINPENTNNSGLGVISNIYYYTDPLTLTQINSIYMNSRPL
jgi:hypothetical protein